VHEADFDPNTLTAEHHSQRHVARSAPSLDAVTARTLTEAMRLCSDGEELVELTVTLPYLPFDFTRLRGHRNDSEMMGRLLAEREMQVAPVRERIERELAAFGAMLVDYDDTPGVIEVYTDPCVLDRIVSVEGVRGIELSSNATADGVVGLEQRAALGHGVWGSTIEGNQGSLRSGGSRVKFGVIDGSHINNGHVSFRDGGAGSMNRIVDTDSCAIRFPGHRRCLNSATSSAGTHGTAVTSAILSDWTDGQESGLSGSTALLRTRVASEAIVHFYSSANLARPNTRRGIKEATEDNGIDIINLSMGTYSDDFCSNNSFNGIRDEISAATDAGVLVVVSGGNDGNTSGCSVSGFAALVDTLAVAGTQGASTLSALDSVDRHSSSSWGSVSTTLDGSSSVYSRFLDLSANYVQDSLAGAGSTGTSSWSGNSFSTPTVAGVAGWLLDWISDRGGLGGLETDPYILRVLLSVMGDGRNPNYGSGGHPSQLSNELGFGNLRFVNLDTEVGSNGGMGVRRVTLNEGDVYEFIVGDGSPTNANGWKFAAIIEDDFYGDSPDVTYELIRRASCGTGTATTLAVASRYALKARIRLRESATAGAFGTGCSYVRATVNHADGPARIYMADYFYSNDRVNHAVD
jgi:hypothetical protein